MHADVSENRLPPENETSARLKITFVDKTYTGQRPELPSLSRHFLLLTHNLSRVPRVSLRFILYFVSVKYI